MTRLRVRGLLDIAADGDVMSADARVHHVHSLAPDRVVLPDLVIGAAFLDYCPVREQPGGISWRATSYECLAPATFVLRNALVHASAGIISLGGDVMAESLAHTDPETHGYVMGSGTLDLRVGRMKALAGAHVTVLAGGKTNYFHSAIDSAARVCMIPGGLLGGVDSLLFPHGAAQQPDMLRLLGLPASLHMMPVRDDESFLVERLWFPWSVHGQMSYHPVVRDFFDRMSAGIADGADDFPRRIYVDRRGAAQRVLENEDEIVQGLHTCGVVAVRPENLCFADQVRLFRQAELIVAPHGAGLTNIGFAQPGCRVLELHMDAYVHWCYRHLSALRGVSYDCVLGKAQGPWLDLASAAVHGMRWRVSLDHVLAAVAAI